MADFMLNEQLKKSSIFIKDLTYSMLLIKNNKNYPWCILVPRQPNLVELTDLKYDDYVAVNKEIYMIIQLLQDLYNPDKINVGSLGNIVSQLHLHVIARFKNDNSYPMNAWGDSMQNPYSEEEIAQIKAKFLAKLK